MYVCSTVLVLHLTQVYGSVVKFISGMTTMASTIKWNQGGGAEDKGGLELPTLAVCPGYRPEVARGFLKRGFDHAWALPDYFHSHPEEDRGVNGQLVLLV